MGHCSSNVFSTVLSLLSNSFDAMQGLSLFESLKSRQGIVEHRSQNCRIKNFYFKQSKKLKQSNGQGLIKNVRTI